MSEEKICILCGKSIKESSSSDPCICIDCDRSTFEKRYKKTMLI